MLRVTAQLVRAADDFHLWSKTYDRELKDILMIQEDIAKAVANELKTTLGIGKSFKQLGGTDNVEAYELYLVGQGLKLDGGKASSKRALESLDAAIALDPEFALAWSEKAFLHEIMSLYVSTDQASAELDAGLNAAQRAIEIETNLAEAYASLGSIRSAAGDWIEAELAFRKAFELATEPSQVIMSYPPFLFAVGYFEKAFQFLETVRSSDPLSPIIRRNYITNLGFFGDIQRAEEENERAKALLGEQWIGHSTEIITEVRLGTGDSESSDEISVIPFLGNIEIESKENGLAELHRLYDCMTVMIYLSAICLLFH